MPKSSKMASTSTGVVGLGDVGQCLKRLVDQNEPALRHGIRQALLHPRSAAGSASMPSTVPVGAESAEIALYVHRHPAWRR
ncbi:MAG: hypothetical protein R2851_25730 [Caldilineaceae bacterium]